MKKLYSTKGIGALVRVERKAQGYTQIELAEISFKKAGRRQINSICENIRNRH